MGGRRARSGRRGRRGRKVVKGRIGRENEWNNNVFMKRGKKKDDNEDVRRMSVWV